MDSTVNWKEGTPKNDGIYLVTYNICTGGITYCTCLERCGYHWYYVGSTSIASDINILAWCKVSDIKPFSK